MRVRVLLRARKRASDARGNGGRRLRGATTTTKGAPPGALRRLRRLGRRLSSGRRSAPPSDDGVDSFRPEARGKMRYRSFLDRPEPPEESLSSIQHLQRILPIGISDIISGGIRQRKVLDESPDWTGPHDGARLERERRVRDRESGAIVRKKRKEKLLSACRVTECLFFIFFLS